MLDFKFGCHFVGRCHRFIISESNVRSRMSLPFVGMMAASSSLGHDKLMEKVGIKMPERKYIIPPDEESDEDDDDDMEEITLSEMEVGDEEAAGRDEEQNEDSDEEEIENMELLEVSTEGDRGEGDLGDFDLSFSKLEPEVELLEVSTEEVDLGIDDNGDFLEGENKGHNLEGEFDPDEDMEESLVIDEDDEDGREEGDEKEYEERDEGGEKEEKGKSGGNDEWKPLELLPAGWKFKETPRHDGGKKVIFFPQNIKVGWIVFLKLLSLRGWSFCHHPITAS